MKGGRKYIFLVLVFAAIMLVNITEVNAGELVVHDGRSVAFDYTLTVDGQIVDSSKGSKPLEYIQGDGKIIPGLARQMEGLKPGESKTIVVSPEEAYGKINPEAIREIPLSSLPSGAPLEVGMPFQAQDNAGKIVNMRVAQVKEDSVLMDMNHPLAGKTLTFNVKVVSVKDNNDSGRVDNRKK